MSTNKLNKRKGSKLVEAPPAKRPKASHGSQSALPNPESTAKGTKSEKTPPTESKTKPVKRKVPQLTPPQEVVGTALARVKPKDSERLYKSSRADSPVSDLRVAESSSMSPSNRDLMDIIESVVSRDSVTMPPYSETHPDLKTEPEVPPPKADASLGKNVGLCGFLPPISDLDDIVDDIRKKFVDMGIETAINALKGRPLTIFTMCSGTEAPIIALDRFKEARTREGQDAFEYNHVASAEIEPFKQAYIEENFEPKVLYRDVVEFSLHREDPNYIPKDIYGAPKPLPDDVDIVVAGTSCVDYSTLNKKRKKFKEGGPSWNTFQAVGDYAAEYRPRMLLLENVSNAPLLQFEDYWRDRGYAARAVILDTKDFYLPQTRERGYMLAFEEEKARKIGLDCHAALDKWQKMLEGLLRRASSPFSSFLVHPDDQAFERIRQEILTLSKPSTRSHLGASSERRHAEIRHDLQLGVGRKQTNWQNNGACHFPDFTLSQNWGSNQVERIWDLLEISHLRNIVERDYDSNYKRRYLDISQNVDFEPDTRQWGLIGCLTPAGMPYDTLRMGPLTGREVLIFQGIDERYLIITRQSSKRLQDFAGNAMSMPVIMCTLLAGLIAGTVPSVEGPKTIFCRPYEATKLASASQEDPHLTQQNLESEWSKAHLQPREVDLGVRVPESVEGVKDVAQKTWRLCDCEGYTKLAAAPLSICTDCGHTACGDCKGTPRHNYQELAKLPRLYPYDFVSAIENSLPKSLTFKETDISKLVGRLFPFRPDHDFIPGNGSQKNSGATGPLHKSVRYESETMKFRAQVIKATRATYRMHSVKRDRVWKVEYLSPNGRLVLCISPHVQLPIPAKFNPLQDQGADCIWYLFAECAKDEPSLSDVREVLGRPIAMMSPTNDLLQGDWQLWDPQPYVTEVKIIGEGEQVDSYEKSLGICHPDFRYRTVFEMLDVSLTDVPKGYPQRTKFKLHGNCGTAFSSLYLSVEPGLDGRKQAFFLYQNPLGQATHDAFSFGYDFRRYNNGDRPLIVARIDPKWRQVVKNGRLKQSVVECEILDRWDNAPQLNLMPTQGEMVTKVWVPVKSPRFDLSPCDESHGCNGSEQTILGVMIPCSDSRKKTFKLNTATNVNLANRYYPFKGFEWLLNELDVPVFCQSDLRTAKFIPLGELSIDNYEDTCAPKPPDMKFYCTKIKAMAKKVITKPFEDPKQAVDYERALKARPKPIIAKMHSYDDKLILEVKINPVTLAHQCVAALRDALLPRTGKVQLKWRLTKYDPLKTSPIFIPRPLLTTDNPSYPKWDDKSALAKNWWIRDLWGSQVATVSWARFREKASVDWYEQEHFDVPMPSLKMSCEVRGSLGRTVRGGVIADAVGSGKSTTATAIFAADLHDMKNQGSITPSPKFDFTKQRIVSQATLVLVPNSLIGQWEKEIKACFKNPAKHLQVVKKAADLETTKVTDLVNAQIILAPYNIFDQEKYWDPLRRICYAPNVPLKTRRAFNLWLSKALETLGKMLCKYGEQRDEKAFWKERPRNKDHLYSFGEPLHAYRKRRNVNETKCKIDKAAKKYIPDPSEFSETPAKEDTLDFDYEADLNQAPVEKYIPGLFHLFVFRRIIIDEFTYLENQPLVASLHLKSEHRWLMSGTPSNNAVAGLDTMARLVGTRITNREASARDFESGMRKTAAVSEQSHAEQVQNFGEITSVSKVEMQQDVAHDFCELMLRRNEADLSGTKKKDHYEIIKPSPLENATYYETYQVVSSQSMGFNKKYPKPTDESRGDKIKMEMSRTSNTVEALICCTSAMRFENNVPTGERTNSSCDGILNQRIDAFRAVNEKLRHQLEEAFGYAEQYPERAGDKRKHWCSFLRSTIKGSSTGDLTLTNHLDRLLAQAEKTRRFPGQLLAGEPSQDEELSDEDEESSDEEDEESSDEDEEAPEEPVHDAENPLEVDTMSKATKKTPVRIEEMKKRTNVLRVLIAQLATLLREIRYWSNVGTLAYRGMNLECVPCNSTKGPYEMVLLSGCGHAACWSCLSDLIEQGRDGECPYHGCDRLTSREGQIAATHFAASETTVHTFEGSRMSAIVCKITEIQSKPGKDCIIVFVQYASMRDHLLEALTAAGIGHVNGTDLKRNTETDQGWPRTRIEKFMKAAKNATAKTPPTKRVLVLQTDTPNAAGWNLQCANHVMCVAPFVADSQQAFESVMKQAIGRALRALQTAPIVHVYHFIAAGTIDVQVLEERMKQTVVQHDGNFIVLPTEQVSKGLPRWGGPVISTRDISDAEQGEEDGGEGKESEGAE